MDMTSYRARTNEVTVLQILLDTKTVVYSR